MEYTENLLSKKLGQKQNLMSLLNSWLDLEKNNRKCVM